MKLNRFMTVLILTCSLLSLPRIAAAQTDSGGTALVLTVTGAVTPAMEQYISRGLQTAQAESAELVVIQLDTPGGQIDIMNKIVQDIRASSIPVVVYVSPRGAMAASAGSIITLAGHAAAMAPETIIGAASPVGSQGEDIGETMEAKSKAALTASIRSLASRRAPEAVALAEEMVNTAKAVSADEALKVGLIDIIADDVDSLLLQLNGMQVYVNDQPVTLMTADLVQKPLKASFIEQLLATLINPNIVFLLITIGVQAIFIELSSPGGWVAGFIGAVCLALAVYGLGVLPVNWFGILFLVIAIVLFIMEFNAPTHGALATAGAACIVIGALVLFNTSSTPSGLHVSVPLVVGTGVVMAAVTTFMVGFALRAQKMPIKSGQEAMIDREGVVRVDLVPAGEVLIKGEMWSAESADGAAIPIGTRVKVVRVDGLRVIVTPVESQPNQTADPRS